MGLLKPQCSVVAVVAAAVTAAAIETTDLQQEQHPQAPAVHLFTEEISFNRFELKT